MGVSGEAADIYVRCETCEKSRPMSDAFSSTTTTFRRVEHDDPT